MDRMNREMLPLARPTVPQPPKQGPFLDAVSPFSPFLGQLPGRQKLNLDWLTGREVHHKPVSESAVDGSGIEHL